VDAVFTVTLAGTASAPVTVDYATTAGTATADVDFTSRSGTLTFAPGVATQTITVPVVGDLVDEPNETFAVTLTNPVGATLADGQGQGTIVDDEATPTPTLTVNDVTVTEGNAGGVTTVFTVSLSAPAGQAVSVSYATANGTATSGSDYTARSGTVTLAAGSTVQTVSVPISGDTRDENDEVFYLNLSGASNATLADPQGQGTIVDDDAPPTVSIADVAVTEGNSGRKTAKFTVRLSAASGKTITLRYATSNGTATAGSDYVASTGSVTFAAGVTQRTISVSVNGDRIAEPNETFFVTLTDPVNVTLARPQATGTITNDDQG